MANNATSQKKSGQHVRRRPKRTKQNARTYRNIQRRRSKHDKAHGLKDGTTNAASQRFAVVPSAKG